MMDMKMHWVNEFFYGDLSLVKTVSIGAYHKVLVLVLATLFPPIPIPIKFFLIIDKNKI